MSLVDLTLYTAGHSNRTRASFLELLCSVGVETLVDVRRMPHSTRHPHFDSVKLRQAIEEAGLVYHWAGHQLGGYREPVPDSPHVALEDGFRGYADHMASATFQRAIVQLVSLGRRGVTAIMCAEKEPDNCHRSLIGDYLTLRGARVLHLVEVDDVREHVLNSHLRRESGQLVYDRGVSGSLFDA